jgi:glycosyltransferase involved in cell wall biosynthesis
MRRLKSRAGDPRLHVAVLIERLGGGGAERVATDLALRIAPHRYRVTLLVPRIPPDWRTAPEHEIVRQQVDALERHGVRVVAWSRTGKLRVWEWHPLVRLLVTDRPAILHAHKLGAALWGGVLGKLARVPALVVHDHGASAWSDRSRRALYRYLVAPMATVVVTVSAAEAARMTRERGVPARKVAVVVNGIEALPPGRRDVRAELGIAPGAPLVVTVAMLRPEKGLEVLLHAAALLRRARPDLRVLIAGADVTTEPETAAGIRSLLAELELDETVRLLGARDDVPDLLAAADVAVNPSHYEGTPIAVLEYMDAGVPVVATSVGGVPAVLADGVDGLLVPADDPAALAAGVERLLGDPELRSRLSRSARRRRSECFTIERAVQEIERLYEAAVA